VTCYETASALRPDQGKKLAWVLDRAGRKAEASVLYEHLCRRQPEDYELFAYFILCLVGRSEPGVPAKLEVVCREAIHSHPGRWLPHHELAAVLLRQSRPGEAVSPFREAIRLHPEFGPSHYLLGEALLRQDSYREAGAEYRAMVRLMPTMASAWNNLGVALAGQGQAAEAAAAFKRAVGLEPDSDRGWYNLGLALASSGRLNEAVAAFEKADMSDGYTRTGAPPDWFLYLKDPAERAWYQSAMSSGEAQAIGMWYGLGGATFCRWNAARAAARAAAGQGEDAGAVDEGRRVKLRRLALGWLRADLRSLSSYLANENLLWDSAREAVSRRLRDPELAGVRAPDALARLPEDERVAWRAFWTDLGSLLSKAREARP
jgi:tetratricopeptide (TPR) repeat protein